jgi:hypothetical protein
MSESVDVWPMATSVRKTFGGKPKPISVPGRDRWLVSSSWGAHVAAQRWLSGPTCPCGGPSSGELSGGNWIARTVPRGFGLRDAVGWVRACPAPDLHLFGSSFGGSPGAASAAAETIVTWLILPVVICLSQRLSHACLSISNLYRETANGSLNQLSFI